MCCATEQLKEEATKISRHTFIYLLIYPASHRVIFQQAEIEMDKSPWYSKIKLPVHFKQNAVSCMRSTNGSDSSAIQHSEEISCVPANTQTHFCFLGHVLYSPN